MAGINILDLVEATEVNETTDYLVIVDKSDTSQDITGSTKKITVKNLLSGLLDFFYPVGTIYETTSSDLDTVAKMNAHFGGTWEFYGAGKVLVAKSADTEFDTIGETGGAKTHTLSEAEMPTHSHELYGTKTFGEYSSTPLSTNTTLVTNEGAIAKIYWNDSSTGQVKTWKTGNSGGGTAHNNLQPYIVVYRYRRIS